MTEPKTPEEWRIQFEACNEILKGVGMQAYQLTYSEEDPVQATVDILTERQKWLGEEL